MMSVKLSPSYVPDCTSLPQSCLKSELGTNGILNVFDVIIVLVNRVKINNVQSSTVLGQAVFHYAMFSYMVLDYVAVLGLANDMG